jgi:Origin recognition complex (ORC) subunit 4 C-terminus
MASSRRSNRRVSNSAAETGAAPRVTLDPENSTARGGRRRHNVVRASATEALATAISADANNAECAPVYKRGRGRRQGRARGRGCGRGSAASAARTTSSRGRDKDENTSRAAEGEKGRGKLLESHAAASPASDSGSVGGDDVPIRPFTGVRGRGRGRGRNTGFRRKLATGDIAVDIKDGTSSSDGDENVDDAVAQGASRSSGRGRGMTGGAVPEGASKRQRLDVGPPMRRATRDLSACVALAHQRLSTRPVCDVVESMCSALQKSLDDPMHPSASFLLIAPRNAGKSAIVSSTLAMLADIPGAPCIVRVDLHGLFHSSSPAAIRAIAMSLSGGKLEECDDMEVGDAVAMIDVSQEDGIEHIGTRLATARQGKCNSLIETAIEQIKKDGKGIVFVVDEFDRFAQINAHQPVLYNILNLLQDAGLRGAFIGMTTHLDAADGLEKRIKSRFSPKEITLSPPSSIDEVMAFLESAMRLPVPAIVEQLGGMEHVITVDADNGDINGGISTKFAGAASSSDITEFNLMASEFLASPPVRSILSLQLCSDRAMGRIVDAMIFTVAALVTDEDESDGGKTRTWGRLSAETLKASLGLSSPSLEIMHGLSTLEMALLTALKKLEDNRNANTHILFGDVYREYALIKEGGREGFVGGEGEPIADQSVAEKAWGRLVDSCLVVRSGPGPSNMRQVMLSGSPIDVDIALKDHPGATEFLKRWGKGITE